MTQDLVDLLKVMLVTALLAAASALVLFGVIALVRQYGASLPLIGDAAGYAPPSAVPVLVDMRFLIVLGAVFLTASGLALVLTSTTLDTALLILAKAVCVLLSAGLGIFAGTWLFMRLTEGTELSLTSLNRPAIALLVFLLFASVLRNAALRSLGTLRLVAALGLVLLGPVVLTLA